MIYGFEKIFGFPKAAGAIDFCHIKIKEPVEDVEDHINWKDYNSPIL